MPTKEEILKIWKDKIVDKSQEIDPDSEYVWKGIFIGLVIGMGGTIDQANDLYEDALALE